MNDQTDQFMPDYSVSGDGEATVYLLHGLYGSKEYWKYVTMHLVSMRYRVVAWDAPGYGGSSPVCDFSLAKAADIFTNMLRKTATERNILFGQSMGSQIAVRVAQRAPTLVAGVIVCASIGYFGSRSREEKKDFVEARKISNSLVDSSRQQLVVVHSMMAPGANGPDVELVRRVGASTPGPTVQMALEAIRTAPDDEAVAAFKSIDVPSIFIAGALDKVGHPEGMEKVSKLVTGSRFVSVSNSAHYPWAEQPEEFWAKLDPFLEEVSQGGYDPYRATSRQ